MRHLLTLRPSLSLLLMVASLATAGAILAQDTSAPSEDGAKETPAAAEGSVDWSEVFSTPQGKWPEPMDELQWRGDLSAAIEEAQETGRPLLVTARCLPCKQCATIDKEVLEGGPELTPLMSRFVTVRLLNAFDLDLRLLPAEGFQDFDVSWWVYLLSPEGEVYGVFGGKDEVSDATRISTKALANTLTRVLDHHSDPRRKQWKLDGPAADWESPMQSSKDLPGFESWEKSYPDFGAQGCMHCHQVAEVLRQPAIEAGNFDPVRDVQVWPYPENVGLTVDRDDGLLVTVVQADSPAAKIGVQVGDRLAAAGGRRLFGQTDLRGVLHREAWPAGEIELRWIRDGEQQAGNLQLAKGWRKTILDWRMSISQGNIGPDPGFFPLTASRKQARKDGMAISPYFGRGADSSLAFQAGLRPSHVILAINGESPNLNGRAFLVWFRLNHRKGQELELTVLEGDRERVIRYTPK